MFLIYNPETRLVEQSNAAADEHEYRNVLEEAGASYLRFSKQDLLAEPQNYWVRKGRVLVPKKPLPVEVSKRVIKADNEDVAVISRLPKPCTVFVDGEPCLVEDGELALSAPYPSVFHLSIDHAPYLAWSLEIISI